MSDVRRTQGGASAPGASALSALLAATLVVAGCAPRRSPAGVSPATDMLAPADAAWVERTLARLDLPHKVAQLVVPRVSGAFLPAGSREDARVRMWVQQLGVGGLIETLGPPMEAAAKLNRLQRLADIPLLITADMEDGPGQLLNGGVVLPYGLENGGGVRFPPAMGLGATGDTRLAGELGRITAEEGRAIGVHMDFAPVVDVNNNPANPIINTRSFGADPALVSRMAAAMIHGLQDNGMLATAKHFPGHGDTGTDSHIELPVITVTPARADTVELPPYRAAIRAGVSGIMSAHIAFPALAGNTTPATLNPALLTGLLRDSLHFDGIVITDALDMGAIVKGWGATEAPVLALQAGADLLLQIPPDDVASAIDAVVAAVRQGRITEARIDQSVRRVLGAKARLGLQHQRIVDLDSIAFRVATPEHVAIAREAAERAITLVRDRQALLPVRGRHVLSIVYHDDINVMAGRVFHATLAPAESTLATAVIDAAVSAEQLDSLRTRATDADVVVFAPFVRVGAYRGDLSIADPVAALVRELAREKPLIVVSFGSPYLLNQFPDISTYLLAWGQWSGPQEAAARAMAGVAPITGRLPIPIPPWHALGEGITMAASARDTLHGAGGTARHTFAAGALPGSPSGMLHVPGDDALPRSAPAAAGMDAGLEARVDSLVGAALRAGASPGAAVAIGRHGRLVLLRGYGQVDGAAGSARVTDSTLYDLASLTKVIATTTAIMMLVDQQKLDVDAPVARYLPEWQGDAAKNAVTVRQLLLHDAGLPAWEPLWKDTRGKDAYLARVAATPLEYPPGTKTVYSDLGGMLLGFLVERISGEPLDDFFQQRIAAPLGLRETGFNPLDPASPMHDGRAAEDLTGRIAPTEVDTVFRMTHVHGRVHDENGFAMGGVSGHAGLFSSARDMAGFAQLLLDGGALSGVRLVQERTLRRFTQRASDASSRALGWDTPSANSSAGDWFSSRSFGHTGFTGTSLWIDPERDVFLVLLTNRVDPSRDNPLIAPLRRALAECGSARDSRSARQPPMNEPHGMAQRLERIPVHIVNDTDALARLLARRIEALIRERAASGRTAVLGLATGSTPIGIYRELIRMHREEGLSFASVVTFNLDEYYPMSPGSIHSFQRYMRENLFAAIDIPAEHVHMPRGDLPRAQIESYCQAYEAAIHEAGGIDFQILGIGKTGHIGFNEPGSSRTSRTRLVHSGHHHAQGRGCRFLRRRERAARGHHDGRGQHPGGTGNCAHRDGRAQGRHHPPQRGRRCVARGGGHVPAGARQRGILGGWRRRGRADAREDTLADRRCRMVAGAQRTGCYMAVRRNADGHSQADRHGLSRASPQRPAVASPQCRCAEPVGV